MKKLFLLTILLHLTFIVKAQTSLSLDSCRALALTNNKDLLISHEKINAAHYQRKAAFTNYLPNFSATGAYMRNQKEFSLLNNDQKAALSGLGSNLAGPIGQAAAGIIATYPELAPLISSLSGSLPAALDQAGNSLVDALRTDTRNVYAGAITLTQPLYMGGKIRAYNKITKYAEELARQQHNGGMQEVIMSTDQAYWQVISLVNKKKLAEGYLKLLQQLDSDVEKMIAEGVATKADGLSVRVKVNEAEMTLTKVEDGLSLARMLLCQLCGLDLSSPITLADENMENIPLIPTDTHFDLSTAYENRPEIRSLELATQIYKQKVNVTRAEHLPSIALMGNYMVTNPSVFNSFENKFKGMWNVGVMVQLPIWHWGEGIYKTKAAKAEARIAQYQLQDAREKIELQVNQAAFKVNEAGKKLVMASKNMEKAEENYKVPNLEKGIAVLEYLSLHTQGETLQDIKSALDISQTTAYRILNTLVRLDYLIYNEDTKRYKLSRKLLTLGFRSLNEHNLLETVLPRLRDLRDQVKETACFGVLGDRKGIFIEQAQGHHTFRFILSPGKPFDLHCSAPGKAIMAYLPNTVRDRYLSYMEFTRYNARTITTRDAYLEELEKVRKLGYAMDNEEELNGVICIGAPIFNYTGYPCGAIWISGPKDRLSKEVVRVSADCIRKVAQTISLELGYSKAKKI